mgnify:CR=1 FL=1
MVKSYGAHTNVLGDNPGSPPHRAIMLVSAYLVERGLILEPYQVDSKTNEIKAKPRVYYTTGCQGCGVRL